MQINYQNNILNLSTKYKKGNSSLIFLIHGGGCTKESFDGIWEREETHEYSIFTVDLVGHGDSSKPEDFSYKLQDQAEVLKLLLKQIDYKTIHIVGHSRGGAIGLLLIERLAKVNSFISIEGNLIGSDCGLSRTAIGIPYEEFKKNKLNELQNKMKNLDQIGAHLWVEWSKKASPYALYKSMRSTVEWSDSGELLKKFNNLKIKKTYFYGEKSANKEAINQIKGAEIIKISNSGHFVMNDNPMEFYNKFFGILFPDHIPGM